MTESTLTIATWNVNSIRARLDRLLAWLRAQEPDVLLLQETKVEDGAFPRLPLQAAGYRVEAHGQRTYNGVAVLSRLPLSDVARGLPEEHGVAGDCVPAGDAGRDVQARLLAATVSGIRVVCAYVPNGQTIESEKFAYKLRWLSRLRRYLDARCDPARPVLLAGDFNVAPEARDVHDPAGWEGSVLFHPAARAALATVREFGLRDTLREMTEDAGIYTWWDYRMLAFPKNRGLRIDHVLVTAPLAARLRGVRVDRDERKGKGASDHAPVIATFAV